MGSVSDEEIKRSIEALCKNGVDGAAPAQYKVTEDGYGLVDK